MERTKQSAMKAIAKRPKLFPLLSKGADIATLKKAAQVSGGFIRSLIWAGVAEIEDGIVKLNKKIKKSDLPDLDVKEERKERKPKREKEEKESKKSKRKAIEDDEDEEIDEPKGKSTESRMVRLIKPVGDIPANMKIKAVKKDDFWWVEGKRIALSNLQFVK
jgi:hypothetical protein